MLVRTLAPPFFSWVAMVNDVISFCLSISFYKMKKILLSVFASNNVSLLRYCPQLPYEMWPPPVILHTTEWQQNMLPWNMPLWYIDLYWPMGAWKSATADIAFSELSLPAKWQILQGNSVVTNPFSRHFINKGNPTSTSALSQERR